MSLCCICYISVYLLCIHSMYLLHHNRLAAVALATFSELQLVQDHRCKRLSFLLRVDNWFYLYERQRKRARMGKRDRELAAVLWSTWVIIYSCKMLPYQKGSSTIVTESFESLFGIASKMWLHLAVNMLQATLALALESEFVKDRQRLRWT